MVCRKWTAPDYRQDKCNKTQLKSLPTRLFQIPYEEKEIKEVTNITFLGLEIDQPLNWKTHIEQIVSRLSNACYAVRSIFHFSYLDTLKMIYFAYFHSIMKYGIIFWGNHTDSMRVFQLQKKIVRIMTGTKSSASCKPLFKALEILTLPSQYVLSLMNFLLHNLEILSLIFLYTLLIQEKTATSQTNSKFCIISERIVLCEFKNL
jgi:hypothetical protein